MLTLTIKIQQRPEGIAYTIDPDDQQQSALSERIIGEMFQLAIAESMRQAAKDLKCGLKLVSLDDPRNRK